MPVPAIGLAPLGFLELAPPNFVAIAAEAGFASVGLRTRAAVLGGAEYPLASDPALMRRTQQVIADTGPQVSSIEQMASSATPPWLRFARCWRRAPGSARRGFCAPATTRITRSSPIVSRSCVPPPPSSA